MRNKWFEEVFLAGIEKRMTNSKYPNSCILTEKQADICYKYMECRQHRNDYGKTFSTYVYKTPHKSYQMSFAGRYTFLNMIPNEKQVNA